MKTSLLSFLLFCCCAFLWAQPQEAAIPDSLEAPATAFVMQLCVDIGEAYTVGRTPQGVRTVIPITGGNFRGPSLRGTILSGGADYQMAQGRRTTLEAIYSICTDDSVCIHVRNRGIISQGTDSQGRPTTYFRAAPQFEAPEDSPYSWLNNTLFLCTPAHFQSGRITLNVWRVK